jgi:DNA-binding beta-propeller fold protein YncE
MGVVMLAALAGLVLPAGALGFAPLSSFGAFGSGVGQLDTPGNIAIGPEGSAYVADYENNRIAVFSSAGIFERAFGEGVVDGSEALQVCTTATGCLVGKADGSAGAMDLPEDIAFGPDGDVYVADQNNNRVDVFTPSGTFLRAFGREVEASGSGGVCTAATGCRAGVKDGSAGALSGPEGLAFGAGGDLYVADSSDERVDVFTPTGTFVRAFGAEVKIGGGDVCTAECQGGTAGPGAGEMSLPYDVVAGPGGLLAVTDSNNNRVDVFTSEGAFVRAFGKEVDSGLGGGDICTTECRQGVADGAAGSLDGPTADTVDAGGNLYIADTGNNRVGQFSFSGAFIRAFGEGVLDGDEAFQVCAGGAECQAGLKGTIAGSTPEPFGVAVDCRGGVDVVEVNRGVGMDFARVERFGDVAVPPPCTQPEEAVRVSLRKFAPSNHFRLRIHLNPKRGTATATVLASAGIVVLRGAGVRRFAKRIVPSGTRVPKTCRKRKGTGHCVQRQPNSATLPIRPIGKAKRALEEAGQAEVRIQVTFTPTGGTPATKHRTLTVRMSDGR